MTRQEARKAAEVMLAYANGEEVEIVDREGQGVYTKNPTFNWWGAKYRVAKPKPAYRPFKNKEECWQEMLKHQPLGWIELQDSIRLILSFNDTRIWIGDIISYTFEEAFDNFKFVDGTPFGIKEE